jgi:hypothetical protein
MSDLPDMGTGSRRRFIALQPRVIVKTASKGSQGGADELKRKIDKAGSINAVTDLMLLPETQKSLNELPVAVRDDIRDYAKARLVALGWPAKQAA